MENDFTWISFVNYDQKKVLVTDLTNNLKKNPNHLVEIGIFTNFSKSWIDFISNSTVTHIMIPVHSVNLLHDLDSSYQKKEIFPQFLMDVMRSRLFINGHLVTNINNAVAYLHLKYSSSVCTKIFILCTQAIFGFILEKLQFSINHLDYYIFETNLPTQKKLKIYLTPSKNTVKFKITKILRVVKFVNDLPQNIKHFKLLLEYELYKERFQNLVVNIYS